MEKQAVVNLADLAEVEIAEFPCVDQKGRRWEEKTGHELVATFAEFGGKELKPPAVLGHNERTDLEGKPIEGATGMPALGWVKGLAMKGAKLVAAIGQVPAVVAELINKGAYKRISGSWWPDGEAAGIPGAKGRAVLRHVGLLGADTPRIKTLADVQALYQGEAPAAALADDAQADVAEFVDAAPAAEQKPPENLKEAILTETTRERLQPIIQAIHSRLWIIQEQHGRSDVDVVAALKELAAELAKFLAAYEPSPGAHSPEEVAAAAMAAGQGGAAEPVAKATDAPGSLQAAAAAPAAAAGGDRPNGEKPVTGIGPVAAMSDASKDQIATFVARLTAEGRLAPKHAPRIRAEAAACFAHGGDEAVAAYLDDEDGLRKDKVVALGETGKAGGEGGGGPAAEFADPAADAAAEAEFDRFGFGRSLGITREQYVAARRQKQK
jgi:hypothetical protein